MKIAITGHRSNKLGGDYDLKSGLMMSIRAKIIETIMNPLPNPDELTLISGMALGIDTLFAKIAIGLNIPLIAAIPCNEQDRTWPQRSREIYHNLLDYNKIQIYHVTGREYSHACMQKRNEWVVDNCDKLIAVWDGTPGGTANCVKYAQSVGKEIIFINPNDLNHD